MKKHALLCVDDEFEIVKSLKLLFEDDFDVFTSTEPVLALNILRENERIVAIISDHRMPEMNGLQFLKKVKELFPNRSMYNIIYSGYSEVEDDMQEMVKARVINEFLTKSCPAKMLIQTVTNGIEKVGNDQSKN